MGKKKLVHRELISARFGEWNHVGSNFTSETSDGLLPGPGSNLGSLLPCSTLSTLCVQPSPRSKKIVSFLEDIKISASYKSYLLKQFAAIMSIFGTVPHYP
jgi:hypothetical protein